MSDREAMSDPTPAELLRDIQWLRRERIARLAALVEWRAIDSAPKDGTRILLSRPGTGWGVVIAWWSESAALYGDSIGFFRNATHWMPLPEPPSERQPGETKVK